MLSVLLGPSLPSRGKEFDGKRPVLLISSRYGCRKVWGRTVRAVDPRTFVHRATSAGDPLALPHTAKPIVVALAVHCLANNVIVQENSRTRLRQTLPSQVSLRPSNHSERPNAPFCQYEQRATFRQRRSATRNWPFPPTQERSLTPRGVCVESGGAGTNGASAAS